MTALLMRRSMELTKHLIVSAVDETNLYISKDREIRSPKYSLIIGKCLNDLV